MFQSPFLSAAGLSIDGCHTDSFRKLNKSYRNRPDISPDYTPLKSLPTLEEFLHLQSNRR